MQSKSRMQEQMTTLIATYGEPVFTKRFTNSRSRQTIYFFLITPTNGVAYANDTGELSPFVVDPETGMFDVWTDNDHFVHIGEEYFKLWKDYTDSVTEQELLEDEDEFELPEGFREKMEDDVIEMLVEGRDYSGYLREQCSYEVEAMTDEQVYELFYERHEEDDEDTEANDLIYRVQCILSNQEIEEELSE